MTPLTPHRVAALAGYSYGAIAVFLFAFGLWNWTHPRVLFGDHLPEPVVLRDSWIECFLLPIVFGAAALFLYRVGRRERRGAWHRFHHWGTGVLVKPSSRTQ